MGWDGMGWGSQVFDGHRNTDRSSKTERLGFPLLQKSGNMGIREPPLESNGK